MLDDFPFAVEEWDDTANSIEQVLARTTNVVIAVAAFDAAIKLYPEKVVMLRNRARVVRSHNLRGR